MGFLLYRRVFIQDTQGKFGRSTVVWITVLIVMFFSSLMWFRLTVCESAEANYRSLIGKVVTEETVRESLDHVSTDMLIKSVIEMCILLSSLGIILNLFSILHRRVGQRLRRGQGKIPEGRHERAYRETAENQ